MPYYPHPQAHLLGENDDKDPYKKQYNNQMYPP